MVANIFLGSLQMVVSGPNQQMVVSQIRGPQCRPQYILILIMGTPKMVPLNLGNPQIYQEEANPFSQMSYSLNSLKGVLRVLYRDYYKGY